MQGEEILKMDKVTYYYLTNNRRTEILDKADFIFETAKLYVIMGPSGSGKTTTLSLLEALDEPKGGQILYKGQDIKKIGGTKYRGKNIGIIFQSYNLFPYLTARENVEVSMEISGNDNNKKQHAEELLSKMQLQKELYGRKIEQLSGGEQQRVAIARALATEASIILADEPTGNLDIETAREIRDIFIQVAHEMKKCVIVVTHSEMFASKADILVRLKNKKLLV